MSVVRVTVPCTEVEDAAGQLWRYEPVAVHEEAAGEQVALVAGFADTATAAMVAAALPSRWTVEVGPAPSDAWWLDLWRAQARDVRVGRLLIWPAWWAPPAEDGSVVVHLDAGRAFGDARHPSTRQCLAALVDADLAGRSVLDVGCGSGVLALAAARLGAAPVVAMDVDPEARRATAANAAANALAIEVLAELRDVAADFDLVLANIGAVVLCELAGQLAPRVRARVVLAGFLAEHVPAVAAAYTRFGLTMVSAETDDGWAVLVLEPGGRDGGSVAGAGRAARTAGRRRRRPEVAAQPGDHR